MARQAVPAPNADSVLVLPDPVRRNAKYIALAFVCMGILAYTYGGPSERSYDDEGRAPSGIRGGHQALTEVFNPGPKKPLNPPYGGKLVDLIVPPARMEAVVKSSAELPSLTLSQRQLCDIELLMNGGFSPLDQFMDQDVYESVVENLRLGPKYNNAVFPMPIVLDVSNKFAGTISVGQKVALRDAFYNLLGILTVTSKWIPDKTNEAQKVLGTTDPTHPAVSYLINNAGDVYLGGKIEGVRLPQHFDFNEVRLTPAQVREKMDKLGWSRFVAFQTRNPMHRAHIELTRVAANEHNLGVLIHPVVGMTKPGDVEYSVRVRCYIAIKNSGSYYKKGGVELSLLPLAMRMAGPREALWHAIIRKNFGASHFIVGRDHAGCKSDITGEDFYGPYDAQKLVMTYNKEIGIEILDFKQLVYVASLDEYVTADKVPAGEKPLSISGTKFRAMMNAGEPIPEWFSHPDVIKILREVSPPLDKRGFALFFTGLSGSGKTTINSALIETLQSLFPTRQLTILDGDVVRTHLSKELGFSIPDRNTNIARMGWVAAEVVRHGGIALCSTISPFQESRDDSREFVEATGGGFIVIHISTSVEECAKRDVKGLYQKAMKGMIDLTGVSHPYEFPDSAELTIDAGVVPVEKSVDLIIEYLVHSGYIRADALPAKYSAVKPETLLKAANVLTEGVVDPAALQCRDKSAPHMGAYISWTSPNGGVDGATVEAVRDADIIAAEKAVGGTGAAGPVTHRTTDLTEAETVEASWKLYYPRKLKFAENKPSKSVYYANPRLIAFAKAMLRVDPCFAVKAVKVPEGEAGVRTVSAAFKAAGESIDDGKAKQFVDAYNADLEELKKRFPTRVSL